MDFELSDELSELRSTVRRIAQDKVAPRARDIDRTGEYPEDLFEVFRDAGLLGLCIPTEYGGGGAGILGLTIAIEEVAKYSNTAALMLLLTRLPTGPLLIAGSEEQKHRYLKGITDGTERAAFGLSEPQAGQRRDGNADACHSRSRSNGRVGAERHEMLDVGCPRGRLVHGVRKDRGSREPGPRFGHRLRRRALLSRV